MIHAIDPGPTQSAFITWDEFKEKVHHKAIYNNDDLLEKIRFGSFEPLVIEGISHYGSGMPVGKEVFETCFFIGRIQEANRFFPPTLIYRREVKINLCGSAKAKDGNIRQALIDRFGPPGTKKNPGKLYGISTHLWAALAVAITYSDRHKFGTVTVYDCHKEKSHER